VTTACSGRANSRSLKLNRPCAPLMPRVGHPHVGNVKYMSQTPDLTIRHANPDDASLLVELGARTFSETFAADNAPEDLAAYLASSFNLAQQQAELADPASSFLVAEVGGAAAGYAKLHAGEPAEGISGAQPVELVRLYVSREWLGLGVGEALMLACLNEAKQAGHETIWLGVWERNGRARAFYRKWNFRAVGEHVFQLGSDPQTDILMVRAV
jgi:diamine N-acetyltransferase